MCHPGRPRPQGESHQVSSVSGLFAFQRAKSRPSSLSGFGSCSSTWSGRRPESRPYSGWTRPEMNHPRGYAWPVATKRLMKWTIAGTDSRAEEANIADPSRGIAGVRPDRAAHAPKLGARPGAASICRWCGVMTRTSVASWRRLQPGQATCRPRKGGRTPTGVRNHRPHLRTGQEAAAARPSSVAEGVAEAHTLGRWGAPPLAAARSFLPLSGPAQPRSGAEARQVAPTASKPAAGPGRHL
jgi:hypothetical protein